MIVSGVLVVPAVIVDLARVDLVAHVREVTRRDHLQLSDATHELLEQLARVGADLRRARAEVDSRVDSPCAAPVDTRHDDGVTFVTVAEAAKESGKSRASIYARIKRGTILTRHDDRGRRLVALEESNA